MANFQGKVPDELYNQLEELKMKTGGGTHADFVERMMHAYELNMIKHGDNLLTAEVEELESLTSRMNRLMINANEKINSALKDKDISNTEKQQANEELIGRLREDLANAKELNKSLVEKLDIETKLRADSQEAAIKSEEQSKIANDLVTQYKEKNDMLLSDLASFKQDREENKSLREQLVAADQLHKQQIEELKEQLKSQKEIVESKEKLITEMNKDYSTETESLTKEHARAIESINNENARVLEAIKREHERDSEATKDKFESILEKEKIALENQLNKQHIEEISKLHQKIQEADALKKQAVLDVQVECNNKIAELQNTLFELKISKMDGEKKTSPKSK